MAGSASSSPVAVRVSAACTSAQSTELRPRRRAAQWAGEGDQKPVAVGAGDAPGPRQGGSTSSPRSSASDAKAARARRDGRSQRRLHLLVGEVEVEPAARAAASARRACQASQWRQLRHSALARWSSSSASVCRARSGRARRRRCSNRRGCAFHQLAAHRRRPASRRTARTAPAGACAGLRVAQGSRVDLGRSTRDRASHRAPRRGCVDVGCWRYGRPRCAGSSHSEGEGRRGCAR